MISLGGLSGKRFFLIRPAPFVRPRPYFLLVQEDRSGTQCVPARSTPGVLQHALIELHSHHPWTPPTLRRNIAYELLLTREVPHTAPGLCGLTSTKVDYRRVVHRAYARKPAEMWDGDRGAACYRTNGTTYMPRRRSFPHFFRRGKKWGRGCTKGTGRGTRTRRPPKPPRLNNY